MFYTAGAPPARRSSELRRRRGKTRPPLARWLCYGIKHLESRLGRPQPEHRGSECFSSWSVKTSPDCCLPGAAVSSYGRPPLPDTSTSEAIFSDLLLQRSCRGGFQHKHNTCSLSSSRKLYASDDQNRGVLCSTELPLKSSQSMMKSRI